MADGTGTLEPLSETEQGAFVTEREQLRANCVALVGWVVAETVAVVGGVVGRVIAETVAVVGWLGCGLLEE